MVKTVESRETQGILREYAEIACLSKGLLLEYWLSSMKRPQTNVWSGKPRMF
jgi:hypothetical protein